MREEGRRISAIYLLGSREIGLTDFATVLERRSGFNNRELLEN